MPVGPLKFFLQFLHFFKFLRNLKMAWGGQISLTFLTISPAVLNLNLNIAVQEKNKALPNVYGYYITPGGS